MSKYSRIWVENALDVVDCNGPFELARMVQEGKVLDPDEMVREEEALEMIDDYAEDSPIACSDCEIMTIQMDEFGKWVCPNCETIHVKQ